MAKHTRILGFKVDNKILTGLFLVLTVTFTWIIGHGLVEWVKMQGWNPLWLVFAGFVGIMTLVYIGRVQTTTSLGNSINRRRKR